MSVKSVPRAMKYNTASTITETTVPSVALAWTLNSYNAPLARLNRAGGDNRVLGVKLHGKTQRAVDARKTTTTYGR